MIKKATVLRVGSFGLLAGAIGLVASQRASADAYEWGSWSGWQTNYDDEIVCYDPDDVCGLNEAWIYSHEKNKVYAYSDSEICECQGQGAYANGTTKSVTARDQTVSTTGTANFVKVRCRARWIII